MQSTKGPRESFGVSLHRPLVERNCPGGALCACMSGVEVIELCSSGGEEDEPSAPPPPPIGSIGPLPPPPSPAAESAGEAEITQEFRRVCTTETINLAGELRKLPTHYSARRASYRSKVLL